MTSLLLTIIVLVVGGLCAWFLLCMALAVIVQVIGLVERLFSSITSLWVDETKGRS